MFLIRTFMTHQSTHTMTITTHKAITSHLKSRYGFGKTVVDLFESVHQDTSVENLSTKNQWTVLTLSHCLGSLLKYTTPTEQVKKEVVELMSELDSYINNFCITAA